MSRSFVFLFSTLSLGFIGSIFFKPYPFSWLIKLLPIGLLVFLAFKHQTDKSDRYFLLGLISSGFGDFFLDYDPTAWFIFGLGSFLIAHLFYLRALRPFHFSAHKWVQLGVCVYGVIICAILFPFLGELTLPVLIYMSVLLGMSLATLWTAPSNIYLVLGGISFVVSDSIIGLNKFYSPISYADVGIMFTYYLAQILLTFGFIKKRV